MYPFIIFTRNRTRTRTTFPTIFLELDRETVDGRGKGGFQIGNNASKDVIGNLQGLAREKLRSSMVHRRVEVRCLFVLVMNQG